MIILVRMRDTGYLSIGFQCHLMIMGLHDWVAIQHLIFVCDLPLMILREANGQWHGKQDQMAAICGGGDECGKHEWYEKYAEKGRHIV